MGWVSRIGREIRRWGRQFNKEWNRWESHGAKWLQEIEDEMTRFDIQMEEAIGISSDDFKAISGDMRGVPTDSAEFRERGLSRWRDVMDPFLQGQRPFAGGNRSRRGGYIVPVAREFYSPSAGQPAGGIQFVGHAPPNASFDSLSVSMSGGPVTSDTNEDRFWSVRLIQRDPNGRPLFVSGNAFARSDDDVIFRDDLRIAVGSGETVYMTTGGPLTEYLPTFVSLSNSGNLGGTPSIDEYQVQVTFQMNAMAVY